MTGDGLVLKDVGKIESIISHTEARIDAQFYSWHVCRRVRREFNRLTYKLYLISGKRAVRNDVNELIREMSTQAGFLKEEIGAIRQELTFSGKIMRTCHDFESMHVPLRLVSAEAGFLFTALKQADAVIAELFHAYKDDLIARNTFGDVTQPFFDAYDDIKRFARNFKHQSASEIAQEQGLF